MTPTETVKLVAIVRQLWPSMKIDEHTPDAWHATLDDLDLSDALAAVRYLARSRTGYVMPADIRRRVADAAGLLPPSEAEALAAAAAVAGAQGVGSSKLHPTVREAYRAMGGPTAFDAPPAVIRPQWARVYAAVVARREEELLAGDLGALVSQQRAAIEPAPEPSQPEVTQPDPTVRDRSADLRTLLGADRQEQRRTTSQPVSAFRGLGATRQEQR